MPAKRRERIKMLIISYKDKKNYLFYKRFLSFFTRKKQKNTKKIACKAGKKKGGVAAAPQKKEGKNYGIYQGKSNFSQEKFNFYTVL